MVDFEYLRNLPVGQYVPGSSFIHRLDPRARILVFTLVLTAVLFSPRPLGLILGAAVVLAGVRLAGLSLGYALRSLRGPLPFLLLLAVLQVFFNAVTDSPVILVRLGPFSITPPDLLAGGMLLLRFAGLVLGINFAGQVLSTSDLAHGLESLLAPLEKLKLPVHDAVMAMIVTVRFLPFLAQSAERIAKAQASRGAEWAQAGGGPPALQGGGPPALQGGGLLRRARAQLPLLVPIFVTSLRRAETMAMAMDARGYASRAKDATSLVEMRFTARDALAVLAGLLLGAAILVI